MLVSINFKAYIPQAVRIGGYNPPIVLWEVSTSPSPVVFKLGIGPCGKEVNRLELSYEDDLVFILQTHTDLSFKRFTYKLSDVVGRIEEEHKI